MKASEIVMLRKRMALSQVEFSSLLGIHHLTVWKWEKGRSHPNEYQIELMRIFKKATENQWVWKNVRENIEGGRVFNALLLLLNKGLGGGCDS